MPVMDGLIKQMVAALGNPAQAPIPAQPFPAAPPAGQQQGQDYNLLVSTLRATDEKIAHTDKILGNLGFAGNPLGPKKLFPLLPPAVPISSQAAGHFSPGQVIIRAKLILRQVAGNVKKMMINLTQAEWIRLLTLDDPPLDKLASKSDLTKITPEMFAVMMTLAGRLLMDVYGEPLATAVAAAGAVLCHEFKKPTNSHMSIDRAFTLMKDRLSELRDFVYLQVDTDDPRPLSERLADC
jgi:hypothetical protein